MRDQASALTNARSLFLLPVDILIATATVAAFAVLAVLVLVFGALGRGRGRRVPRQESLHGL